MAWGKQACSKLLEQVHSKELVREQVHSKELVRVHSKELVRVHSMELVRGKQACKRELVGKLACSKELERSNLIHHD